METKKSASFGLARLLTSPLPAARRAGCPAPSIGSEQFSRGGLRGSREQGPQPEPEQERSAAEVEQLVGELTRRDQGGDTGGGEQTPREDAE
jgi:hypothetical protein